MNSLFVKPSFVKMFSFLSACALAIFMDRFWNQGYLWTPHDPRMTRKIQNFQILKILKKKINNFPSLNSSSNLKGECGPPEATLKRVMNNIYIIVSFLSGSALVTFMDQV